MAETKTRGRAVTLIVMGVIALAGLLGGCSSQTIDATGATVIDVRTPAEYAAGHLQGAVNIDVQSADFATKIAALDKSAHYIVYCRTGVRSANAASTMKAAGFTNVTDGHGMDAASKSTGLPVVTT